MIVPDASVFAKLFLEEADRSRAESDVRARVGRHLGTCRAHAHHLRGLSIGLRRDVPFAEIIGLFDRLGGACLSIEEPTTEELIRAEEIARLGNRASAYPALQDSIYHAMAIRRGGIFITADRRHVAKAKQFGNVVLLADWRAAATPPRP